MIATLKALGATGGRVFAIYFSEVMLLAAVGVAIGLVARRGAAVRHRGAFGPIMPLPIAPALHPGELALAVVYGLLTALAFALWPLGRAHDVPVSALFRDEVAPERRWPRAPLRRRRRRSWSRRSPPSPSPLAYDRKIAADLRRRGRGGVRRAAARRARC